MRLWNLPGEVRHVVRGKPGRHEQLRGRLLSVLTATLVVFAAGTVLMYFLERHAARTEITTVGDAAFFTAVQLLTISSQLRNPVTGAGRVVDVILELYALVVVTSLAGMFAHFFHRADADESSEEVLAHSALR
jgi:hypothetical protein